MQGMGPDRFACLGNTYGGAWRFLHSCLAHILYFVKDVGKSFYPHAAQAKSTSCPHAINDPIEAHQRDALRVEQANEIKEATSISTASINALPPDRGSERSLQELLLGG